MSLHATKTRLALLRLAADGEVWQNAAGQTVDRPWNGDDPPRPVTAAIAELAYAGWVELVETNTGARHWLPTEAGRAVLAAAEIDAGRLPLVMP